MPLFKYHFPRANAHGLSPRGRISSPEQCGEMFSASAPTCHITWNALGWRSLLPTLFTDHMSGVNWIPRWALEAVEDTARFRVVSGGKVSRAKLKIWRRSTEHGFPAIAH
jgi:hypothetical protein